MAKLIIITGFLATMKTTISSRLSNDLKLICLNKDSFKEVLGDTIGYTNRAENLKLSHATFKIMKMMIEKLLKAGIDVIIESNFKQPELIELREILPISLENVLTLFIEGNPYVIYERYKTRQPSRHPVHKSIELMSYETFTASMASYRSDDCFGTVVKCDTTDFNETKYHDFLTITKRFLSNDEQTI
jgi:predicted kinase